MTDDTREPGDAPPARGDMAPGVMTEYLTDDWGFFVRSAKELERFRSPYQVHPLVATTWARRLAPRAVIAANDDYLPGHVNFAVRGGGGSDLRALLRTALPDVAGEFAHGHAAATGGSLDPTAFARMLRALGLDG